MKRVFPKIIILLSVFLVIGVIFLSCKKTDHTYDVNITVKFLGDTNQLVPNANVVIEKNYVRVEGVTNEIGQFTHQFKLEAILNIHATRDTGTMGSPAVVSGNSTIRLLEDKTAYRILYLAP
jgi:hypothetical protein